MILDKYKTIMEKLSTLFLLLAVTFANAQEHKGFGVSLRTGVSRAIKIPSNTTFQRKSDLFIPNFGIGVFYDGQIGNGFRCRSQISFLNRGWRERYVDISRERTDPTTPWPELANFQIYSDIRRNYFISPEFSFMYQFGKRQIRPFLQLGIRTDIYLKSQIVSKGEMLSSTSTTWSKDRTFKLANATAIIGGGVNFRHLSLQVEYNPTLTSFVNQEVYESKTLFHYSTLRIQTLNFVVGYRF